MKARKCLWPWLVCASLVVALPAFGSMSVAAAAAPTQSAPSASLASPHATPFLPITARERLTPGKRSLRRGGSAGLSLIRGATATASAPAVDTRARGRATPLISSNAPDPINAFAGTSQAEDMSTYGDQEVVPPNEDIAAGPSDLIEVVNSTLYVYNRSGAVLGHADLNSFMEVEPGFRSSDPRVIYDSGSQRFWVTVTEIPDTGCPTAAPVIIAVSASSNPLPFSGWLVYGLPVETAGTVLADQPGLGISSNTVAVTFDDFDCSGTFISSEMDILQKVDYEHDSGTISEYFFTGGPPAPQPVQSSARRPSSTW